MKARKMFLMPMVMLLYMWITLLVVTVYADSRATAGWRHMPAIGGVTAMLS